MVVWGVTAAWAVFIFELSGETYSGSFTAWLLHQILHSLHVQLSATAFRTLHVFVRKLAHLTEYAIFSLFLYHSFEGRGEHRWRAHTAVGAIVVAGLYSLTDEFHQSLVRGRTSSLFDCAIDTAGAALGMLILYGHEKLFHTMANSNAAARASREEKANGVAGE